MNSRMGVVLLLTAGMLAAPPRAQAQDNVIKTIRGTAIKDRLAKDRGAPEILIVMPNKTYAFDLKILGIAPADRVLEHQPIDVTYELTVSVTGLVGDPKPTAVAIGPTSGRGTRNEIAQAAVRKYRGTVSCLAPAAGAHAPVSISAFVPSEFGEFQESVVAEAERRIPVAARYEISVDSYTITNTRAVHEDRVKISLTSAVQGHPFAGEGACKIAGTNYCVELADQGDRNNGVHPVRNVRVGPFDLVPEVDPNIGFEFDLMNLGESYAQHVFEVIFNLKSQAAAGILNAVMSGGNFGGLHEFAKTMHSLGKCDGPLAADGRLLLNKSDEVLATSPTLDAMTRDSGYYSEEKFYPGVDSGLGCGSNSEYRVRWSVTRTSWQP